MNFCKLVTFRNWQTNQKEFLYLVPIFQILVILFSAKLYKI